MQLVGVALVSTLSATLTVLLTTLVTVYEPAAGQVLDVSIKIVSPCVRPVIRALLDGKPKAPEPAWRRALALSRGGTVSPLPIHVPLR